MSSKFLLINLKYFGLLLDARPFGRQRNSVLQHVHNTCFSKQREERGKSAFLTTKMMIRHISPLCLEMESTTKQT